MPTYTLSIINFIYLVIFLRAYSIDIPWRHLVLWQSITPLSSNFISTLFKGNHLSYPYARSKVLLKKRKSQKLTWSYDSNCSLSGFKFSGSVAMVIDRSECQYSQVLGEGPGLLVYRQTAVFLLCFHMAERKLASSLASSYRGVNPVPEGSALKTHLPSKGPMTKYHLIAIKISTYEFAGRTQTFSS